MQTIPAAPPSSCYAMTMPAMVLADTGSGSGGGGLATAPQPFYAGGLWYLPYPRMYCPRPGHPPPPPPPPPLPPPPPPCFPPPTPPGPASHIPPCQLDMPPRRFPMLVSSSSEDDRGDPDGGGMAAMAPVASPSTSASGTARRRPVPDISVNVRLVRVYCFLA